MNNTTAARVAVMQTTLSLTDANMLSKDIERHFAILPGFIALKATIKNGFLVLSLFFTSPERHAPAADLLQGYLRNAPETKNVFGTDLIERKIVTILVVGNSW